MKFRDLHPKKEPKFCVDLVFWYHFLDKLIQCVVSTNHRVLGKSSDHEHI